MSLAGKQLAIVFDAGARSRSLLFKPTLIVCIPLVSLEHLDPNDAVQFNFNANHV
jgi:hypothetical protein